MSIFAAVNTSGYADFKTIVESRPQKGIVYYYDNSPTSWSLLWATDDGSFLVGLIGASGTFPASFAADFPNAVQLTTGQPNWTVG